MVDFLPFFAKEIALVTSVHYHAHKSPSKEQNRFQN